ncbi:cation-transporting P-type ATPase [Streptomyces sp. NPDC013172]|uniref:cation-transporting P-type ATPase n=1 Tax=Streptomyces sp. NPDC013172 TaxID=3155009 RepID=UPI0033C248F0
MFSALNASARGLTSADAAARRSRVGPNELTPARRRSLWRELAGQFTDLFAIVLLVASAISFLAYGLQEPREVGTLQVAVAIAGVVVLNAGIGFAQEYSAERAAESLQAMVPQPAGRCATASGRNCPRGTSPPGTSSSWRPGTRYPRTAASSRHTRSPSTTRR